MAEQYASRKGKLSAMTLDGFAVNAATLLGMRVKSVPGIARGWGCCPPKESPPRGAEEGTRCGQTAGSLKNANDLQWRLIAFAISAVALFRLFHLRLRWIFVLKKPSLGKGEGERQMAKKRGTADGRAGRRPPRQSRFQRAKPAETARRAVWPAASVPDLAETIKCVLANRFLVCCG